MRTIASLLVCSLILVSHAAAQPGTGGPPPTFKIVTSIDKDKGHIVFEETAYRAVPVQVVKTIVENGVTRTITVTEYRTEVYQFRSVYDVGTSRVITPDAKQLPIDEVWKRVKAKGVVLVSGDGNTPAQPYLRALAAETIIIIPAPPKK